MGNVRKIRTFVLISIMIKSLILIMSTLLTNTYASEYNHPGRGNFFEFGSVVSKSPYGYEVNSLYGVPRFSQGRFTLEALRLDYDLYQSNYFNFGPVLNYNFSPYAGTERDSLDGMSREGFADYGLLVDIFIGFGQVFIQYTKADHENSGDIFRATLASAIPLLAINSNHIWLNFYFEYSKYSANTASYFFGVKEDEATVKRPRTEIQDLESFTQIYGLWSPITESLWLNLTYRYEAFHKDIELSPIIERHWDQSFLIGLMFTF
jgi:outer membrane scaffolding protein for murein synthesis (MipA/OmpV family)